MANETPSYSVEDHVGRVEIRCYEPYLVAETEVRGSLERAGNSGFGILARYIFGDNDSGEGENATIAMTTPVTQIPSGERYRVRFMMPSRYTVESLPAPKNDRVTIREIEGQRLAAIRYSGSWSRRNHDRQLGELRETLAEADMETRGEPIWARYDPPWQPWFLRHNEVLLAIEG